MNSTDLLQLVDNLQQAGKMHAQHAASLWRFWLFYYHLQATVRRKLFYALFNAQNVHVWQAKHARLAGETCTLKSVN